MRTAQYLTQHNTVVYNTVHSTQDMTSEPSSRHVPPPPAGPRGACAVSDTTKQCTIYSGYDVRAEQPPCSPLSVHMEHAQYLTQHNSVQSTQDMTSINVVQ